MNHTPFRRKKHRSMAEINIVPYIDVMLVLLVIFMITTPLLQQGVTVQLPAASASPLSESQQPPLIVTVTAQGQYFLSTTEPENTALTPDALVQRVTAELLADQTEQVARPVLVRGDKDATYNTIVQAMVLLQQAGVKQIGLMTDPPT